MNTFEAFLKCPHCRKYFNYTFEDREEKPSDYPMATTASSVMFYPYKVEEKKNLLKKKECYESM